MRSCARRSLDAATIFMALVICCVDLTARTRRRISNREGIYRSSLSIPNVTIPNSQLTPNHQLTIPTSLGFGNCGVVELSGRRRLVRRGEALAELLERLR